MVIKGMGKFVRSLDLFLYVINEKYRFSNRTSDISYRRILSSKMDELLNHGIIIHVIQEYIQSMRKNSETFHFRRISEESQERQ